jgi:methionyl-tRNA formyltransferase
LSLRVIFMGTPELACASLRKLLECHEFEVAAVVTQPDRPKGRELKLAASPVKFLAVERDLAVLQPERARDLEFLQKLRQLRPELIAVAAYGQLLPPSLLEIPALGCLNVHTSLLPRYRGAAPIQWAILNGDPETGVTIMKMDSGLDTGPILSRVRTPIREDDDAQTLYGRLAGLGADLLVQTIPRYANGQLTETPQPSEGVSQARKIRKEDGLIDWSKSAREIWNCVRGLVPWPAAFTHLPERNTVLKIWRAEVVEISAPAARIVTADKTGIVVGCGQQALRLQVVQREGGRRLEPREFLAGCPLQPGQSLGSGA